MTIRKVDMVWLDDEYNLINAIIAEHYSHLIIDTYSDPVLFLKQFTQYPKNTKIILDHYYYIYDINCELVGFNIDQLIYCIWRKIK